MACPCFQYYKKFWSPCLMKGVIKLEKVQGKVIKWLQYKAQQNKVELFNVEKKKKDLSKVNKMVSGIESINKSQSQPYIHSLFIQVLLGHQTTLTQQLLNKHKEGFLMFQNSPYNTLKVTEVNVEDYWTRLWKRNLPRTVKHKGKATGMCSSSGMCSSLKCRS